MTMQLVLNVTEALLSQAISARRIVEMDVSDAILVIVQFVWSVDPDMP